ncbi:type II toxin-antitoxin system RelE/ParE family toxin [Sphingobacterium sp. DN00404]|uniref:Type II toxin-antitoxin system RelE/ParE family toxin n=1 Tax=Sphingobacterium micropteri TaxID=2763501 RepID=A0ABR7YU40_9SPHI|nr:type II toxin-antitoxin system RelE/ParE family toxin [Sphingobacterium micropteri]MBD1434683.1 type II toxin-antitoxin system RelE/ParE family toxin [Sphingobacterium micropteri]
MSYEIVVSDVFRRSAKALSKKYPSFKNDLAILVEQLSENPQSGIPLGGNLFKVRLAIESKGRGKSGGARVITFVLYQDEKLLLAEVYDKSDYSSINEKEILQNLRGEGLI